LNTCPVGIATQNPELRKLFTGDPDHVVNYFTFLAEDLREIMATLGFRTVDEMVGKTEVLKMRSNIKHWKYKHLDLSPIFYKESVPANVGIYKQIEQDHELESVLDWKLIETAEKALSDREGVEETFHIRNTDRTTGAMLSNEVSKAYKGEGLPEDTIRYTFRGSAGQSFGAFLARGITFRLEGEANDYFGKGLSGGKLIVHPVEDSRLATDENIIIGNVAFYGATSGKAYIRGMAGERFAVRNSGVSAVVEGVGDHACEYMTGGRIAVLGTTGKNFAAGMSGGIAYVYDPNKEFPELCNPGMVDLDPLEQEDIAQLQGMIEEHMAYTHSTIASTILKNWDEEVMHFVKVIPFDYKKVLNQRKEAENMKIAV